MDKYNKDNPAIVEKAILRANSSTFKSLDYILLSVLTYKDLNETLESIEAQGGWSYIFYLYEFITMQRSVAKAWEIHTDLINKNK